ncbi:unnamed protein product [Pleuronectes platessa]|uniref:Uncharacterized protein n=1 Tax=Pleuronectes platessa TaxID=8262 RepID=A0A9N7TIL7_PLEPL|nr:unnamed protein product [Pleuronectes platessa]
MSEEGQQQGTCMLALSAGYGEVATEGCWFPLVAQDTTDDNFISPSSELNIDFIGSLVTASVTIHWLLQNHVRMPHRRGTQRQGEKDEGDENRSGHSSPQRHAIHGMKHPWDGRIWVLRFTFTLLQRLMVESPHTHGPGVPYYHNGFL